MTLELIPNSRVFLFDNKTIDIQKKISKSCSYNVLKFIPRDFELTTNNCSYFFNANILANSSVDILHHIEENPNYLKYHIDIENSDNVIKKLEKVYQGERIHFDSEEEPIYRSITKKINIKNSKIQIMIF